MTKHKKCYAYYNDRYSDCILNNNRILWRKMKNKINRLFLNLQNSYCTCKVFKRSKICFLFLVAKKNPNLSYSLQNGFFPEIK